MRFITQTLTATTASLAMALLALPAGASTARASAVHDLDSSIVWVDVEFPADVVVPWQDGTTTTYSTTVLSLCTGFFVSDEGEIATAGHCVEADGQTAIGAISNVMTTMEKEGYDLTGLTPTNVDWGVEVGQPTAYVGQPVGIDGGIFSGSQSLIAQIVDFQGFADGDNALLRVADLDGTPGLPVAGSTPTRGEQVTSIGFPGSVSTVADVQRQAPSYKTGTVSSRQYTERGVPNTEIDAAVSPGMSGGPTVDADGAVVGINSFGIRGESQPFNFVTDTETLRDFLVRNGVELTAPATPGRDADAEGEATESTPADGQAVTEGPGEQLEEAAPLTVPQQPSTTRPAGVLGEGSFLWIAGGLLGVLLLLGGMVVGRLGGRPQALH